MSPVRVVVVDDHSLFRAGLIELLRSDPGIVIVADGGTGNAAITLATEHQPDVLLMDVEMPGPGAEATLVAVRQHAPRTAVVILTMHDDATVVAPLLRLGATGYLTKSVHHRELLAAVHGAVNDSGMVTVSVSRRTLDRLEAPPAEAPAALLSARELDVVRLVALACSNAEIASRLYISHGTVKRHLTNLYAKLGATSRLDAMLKARAAGLLPDVDPPHSPVDSPGSCA